jgi:hypothetical protein
MTSKELEWAGSIQKGAKGLKARRIQEWLSLQGFHLDVDGDYGTATEDAVRAFQSRFGLPVTGAIDEATFVRLTGPMRSALRPIPGNGRRLGQLVVAYAEQHLAESPREIGGDNLGPWVRLYNGADGADQKWCAGFVSTILRQACESLGVATPIKPSTSCDELAASAKKTGRFVAGKNAQSGGGVDPGTLFVLQSKNDATDWVHTGIVTRSDTAVLSTIEGNTDHGGSSNGFEATARTRGWARKDFIVV